ncbi:hypothetical protein MWN34_15395 [Ancylobacter sp. 6x-1]|uniref:Uncharacterized protein n=1 Tax=Ancylobacter crimeensis TaxID=2579147 RepID=A0ABT0DE91_9HYPH|nr:hypothetical protein [Ancylobacter crimeensis]MCK0198298.1 hypothetical protein [Ancylobacter crimeensis]
MSLPAVAIGCLILIATVVPSPAQSFFCDRPRKPYIPSYSTDRSGMERAQDDVEHYTRRMKEYVECVQNEQADAVDEHRRVIREWNDAVSSYNNR